MGFFRAALDHKVITVPGEFFDVNPGKRRRQRARASAATCASRSARAESLDAALERLGAMIATAR